MTAVELKPDKHQRTLFSLTKVVRLEKSSVCFTPEDIKCLQKHLLDPTQTKESLLTSLRKLDCYKLEVNDLLNSEIGIAIATLSSSHPKVEVSKLAQALLHKWKALLVARCFKAIPYDTEAAAQAPDGEPEAPAVAIAAEEKVRRREAAQRRRQRELEYLMDSDFDEVLTPDSETEDPSFEPAIRVEAYPRKRSNRVKTSESNENPITVDMTVCQVEMLASAEDCSLTFVSK